jgi:hypothetical protein
MPAEPAGCLILQGGAVGPEQLTAAHQAASPMLCLAAPVMRDGCRCFIATLLSTLQGTDTRQPSSFLPASAAAGCRRVAVLRHVW